MSQPVQQVEAVVAAKEGVYDEIPPEIDPNGDPLFRVAFSIPNGEHLIFWITSEEYYRLEVGMEGLLTYQGDNIISFGDWIKPFHIENTN